MWGGGDRDRQRDRHYRSKRETDRLDRNKIVWEKKA